MRAAIGAVEPGSMGNRTLVDAFREGNTLAPTLDALLQNNRVLVSGMFCDQLKKMISFQ